MDLQKITGIGPAHSAALVKLGVVDVAALAAITEPDKFVDTAVFKAEDLAGWIEQAKTITDDEAQAAKAKEKADAEVAKAAEAAATAAASGKNRKLVVAETGLRKRKKAETLGPRKSVVLLVDDKKHGKRGELVSIPGDAADDLRYEGKARRATLDDFRQAGRI